MRPERGGSFPGFARLQIVKKAVWRALIEVGFIVFLFYSNLLMGEFVYDGRGRRMGFAWAIEDIVTPTNFAIAMAAAVVGYLIFESLRKKS
jgi:F0F1-type ATP synthase membrane subunit a